MNFTRRHVSTLLLCLSVLFGDCALSAQTAGTLLVPPRIQLFDNSGNVLSSGKIYFYEAGTSTPLAVYTDAALTVAHANPVVLDSAGRATIYLQRRNYKVVVTTSADVTLYTVDNVASMSLTAQQASLNHVCSGRMTLTASLPVTRDNVAAATTVYFTPYKGSKCALYDGTSWDLVTFTELSIALGSDAASTNYDLFLFLSAGNPTLERVAWTNATTRATALVLQDGVLVKSGSTTKRYLGTYRTTSTIGQTEDSATKRLVWNYHNRTERPLRVQESTDSWVYTTATLRQANGSTANQVEVVIGVAESQVHLTAVGLATNAIANTVATVAIGEDSTTTAVAGCLMQPSTAQAAIYASPRAVVNRIPDIGYHFFTWLEHSTGGGTSVWYGDNGAASVTQTGLSGSIQG